MTKEVMQQALDAFETIFKTTVPYRDDGEFTFHADAISTTNAAIEALEAAIAQPASQPIEPVSKDAATWCQYLAGMIESYVTSPRPTENREAGIAAIIERRLKWLPATPIVQPVQPAVIDALERYVTANYADAEGATLADRVIDALEKMDIALGMKEIAASRDLPATQRAPAQAVAVPEIPEKMAPVQGYPHQIPWWLHLEAYAAYCKKWSPQPALIDLEGRNCRGGFGLSEMDEFVPGWRDRISDMGKLKAEVARLNALLAAAPTPTEVSQS